jgi:hypothetical protein
MDLEAMPSELLAEAASTPDWAAGVSALHEALDDWWKERAGKVQIVVSAPSGLILGFALKDYASGIVAGIVTMYERPYRPGTGCRWTGPMVRRNPLDCGPCGW